MPLRPYQRATLASSLRDRRAGISSQLIVLPTAAGKTTCVAKFPELFKVQRPKYGMFFVNREDLVLQAAETFRAHNPNLRIGIEMAEHYADPYSDVIIASIQSCGKKDGIAERLTHFDVDRLDWMVLDETHHALIPQVMQILKHFRVLLGEPNRDTSKLLVGITASPARHDGKGLDRIFEKITHEETLEGLMSTGIEVDGRLYPYLAPLRAFRVQTDFDMSMVNKRGGDFAEADLSHALDTPARNRLILNKYQEFGRDLPAIAFTVNIQHGHNLVEMANAMGIPAVVVSGKTSRTERDRIYDAYRAGDMKLMASAAVLAEGSDFPMATVALLTAPTMSGVKYLQSVGRVLRPYPAPEVIASGAYTGWRKEEAIALDFCDLIGRHSLVTAASLFGLPYNFNFKGGLAKETAEQARILLNKHPTLQISGGSLEELRAQVDEVDAFAAPVVRPDVKRHSKYSWLEVFEGVLQLGTSNFRLEVKQNLLGQFEVSMAKSGVRDLKGVLPTLAAALALGDSLVPQDEHALHVTRARWREHPPTEKQCRRLLSIDPRLKDKFGSTEQFYAHALRQHENGNPAYSKGGISSLIDLGKSRGDNGFSDT